MHANTRSAFMALVAITALSGHVTAASAQAPTPPRMIPHFEVDPSWPKLPSKWVWGQVSSVSIDSQGHAWILQRPSTVRNDQKGMAAPPVPLTRLSIAAMAMNVAASSSTATAMCSALLPITAPVRGSCPSGSR